MSNVTSASGRTVTISKTSTKTGKKGAKFGRHKDRSGSMARYRAANRSVTNASKRQARHTKRVLADSVKALAVPRGATRAARRCLLSLEQYLIHIIQIYHRSV